MLTRTMSEELCYTSATELASKIRRREVSPVEVVDAFFERINDRNEEINAYVTLLEEEAREQAQQAESDIESGNIQGPLHGVPVAVKDLLGFKKGVRHTFGLKPLENFVPDEDAIVVERLEEAGAIILGKTNTPEFGHKGTTDNLLFGATGTPFDPEKTAGGSSGGSCAALADGLASLATGSDAGGSCRIPASACGVVGFSPSFARVPHKHRPDAFGSEPPYFQLGPLARSVEDAALMLEVIAGPHPRDPNSLPDDGTDYRGATQQSINGYKIGYSPNLDVFPIDEQVEEIVEDAANKLEQTGATVEEIEIGIEYTNEELLAAWGTGWTVLLATLAENFKEEPFNIDLLGDHRDDIQPELIEMMEEGQEMSAAEFKRANIVRTDFLDKIEDQLNEYDVLVTPTISVPPFDKEMFGPDEVAGEEIDEFGGWLLTYPFNLIGIPVNSIPAGFTDDNLPVGMQVIGRRYADDDVLAVSAASERVNPWDHAYPPR